MKIVVVDRPKFFGFFLRKFFGIPKVKDIAET
ncbi:MAG: stage V sporulation protein SpoVM [Acutalibacteraceae bacterium]